MIFKGIVLLLVAVILYSLGSALYYLVRDVGDSDRVVKALTWRIVLSLLLFVSIFVAYVMGWIAPHGL